MAMDLIARAMAAKALQGGSGGGSNVIANPTLTGNEINLLALEIDGVKYKVGAQGAYITQGNSTFEGLPSVPSQSILGYVWNITNNFTTDDRFVEGSGLSFPSGVNVVVVLNNGEYKYDVLSGFVDLSQINSSIQDLNTRVQKLEELLSPQGYDLMIVKTIQEE